MSDISSMTPAINADSPVIAADQTITLALYDSKPLLKVKMFNYKGRVITFPISHLKADNKALFERMTIIYTSPQMRTKLTEEQRNEGWLHLLVAHAYLVSCHNLNNEITTESDRYTHKDNKELFLKNLLKVIQYYPSSPLVPIAFFQIGFYYQHITRRNPKEAIAHYNQSAERGYLEAHYKIGKLLYNGTLFNDTKKANKDRALKHLSAVSEKGHIRALHYLGTLYDKTRIYTKAFKYFELAAQKGHGKSYFKIGQYYEKGTAGEIDFKKAFEAYTNACKHGYTPASLTLAICYENGTGTEVDFKKAKEFYDLAAGYGMHEAYFKLAELAMKGIAGPANPEIALSHYRTAARKGNMMAHYTLADMYDKGIGTKRNDKIAQDHLLQAATGNYAPAQYKLGQYHERQQTPNSMRIAFDQYKAAADQKHTLSQYKVAFFLEKGLNGTTDLSLAIDYYKKAAHAKNPEASFRLFQLYSEGVYIQCNEKLSLDYLHTAAAANHTPALYMLGQLLEKQNNRNCVTYYRKAADLNYPPALYKMGELEEKGIIPSMAVENQKIPTYFTKAAELGNPDALYKLGLYNEIGLRVPKDFVKAHKYYTVAASKGSEDAKMKLDDIEISTFLNDREIDSITTSQTSESTSPPQLNSAPKKIIVRQITKTPLKTPSEFVSFLNSASSHPKVEYVNPQHLMANDDMFLPLGSSPQPQNYPYFLVDRLHEEDHRSIISQSSKRQKIQ